MIQYLLVAAAVLLAGGLAYRWATNRGGNVDIQAETDIAGTSIGIDEEEGDCDE